jgi:hypothetical protein
MSDKTCRIFGFWIPITISIADQSPFKTVFFFTKATQMRTPVLKPSATRLRLWRGRMVLPAGRAALLGYRPLTSRAGPSTRDHLGQRHAVKWSRGGGAVPVTGYDCDPVEYVKLWTENTRHETIKRCQQISALTWVVLVSRVEIVCFGFFLTRFSENLVLERIWMWIESKYQGDYVHKI